MAQIFFFPIVSQELSTSHGIFPPPSLLKFGFCLKKRSWLLPLLTKQQKSCSFVWQIWCSLISGIFFSLLSAIKACNSAHCTNLGKGRLFSLWGQFVWLQLFQNRRCRSVVSIPARPVEEHEGTFPPEISVGARRAHLPSSTSCS